MTRSDERRDRLVRSTFKAGWAKFGAPEMDEATYDYVCGIANTVMAEAKEAGAGEEELLEQLGPLLLEQGLREKQAASLCRAITRCVFPSKKEHVASARSAEKRPPADAVLCRCEDLILMYLGTTKLLLKDTTFELLKGHRYGIVGHNGAGKTTLMERIAAGAIQELSSSLRCVHIRHETITERADPKLPAMEFARSIVGSGEQLNAALDEVGFTEELKRKAIQELSGGWRVRLLLATAVAQRADVLLLDEPTNHLDVDAVHWLVNYLTRDLRDATSLVVSHDAPFLNRVCSDIIHFDDCQLKYYAGNFASFQEQARLHDEQQVRAVLQVRANDGEPPVRPAFQSTRTSADDSGFRMHFPVPGKVEGVATSKKTVIEIKNASFKYPMSSDYQLRHVDTKVTMSSRVAIVGPNGAGKSTLLAMLCGEVRPTPLENQLGEVNRHRNLRLAYIAQSHVFHLGEYAKCTPVEYVQVRFRNGYDEELQQRLTSPGDKEEQDSLKRLAAKYGKYGKRIEAVVSRTKRGKEWRYEVQWEGLSEKQNTFESVAKLRQLGVERMATALDERLASVQTGNDDRPLTRREIVRHFENFGLSEEMSAQRSIGVFSGGQKSKLIIGAAFWTKPHVVCLDEPTNFLDFETVDALSRALRSFRGGVLIVSHNEDFLASICNEIWSVRDHQVTVVKADTSHLQAEIAEEATEEAPRGEPEATPS
mmetsp:Transcript_168167/g.322893  ORF Transcript_168167/g.322893 Transcript_168167/m.322893 type:complete len:708 (+) Transcript_168167:81-2204(+)